MWERGVPSSLARHRREGHTLERELIERTEEAEHKAAQSPGRRKKVRSLRLDVAVPVFNAVHRVTGLPAKPVPQNPNGKGSSKATSFFTGL